MLLVFLERNQGIWAVHHYQFPSEVICDDPAIPHTILIDSDSTHTQVSPVSSPTCAMTCAMSTTIPTEIWIHILSFLSPEDLSSLHQTCHLFRSLCQVDSLWRPYCSRISSYDPFDSWRDLYTSLIHKWGWLEGMWCGDQRHLGNPHILIRLTCRTSFSLSIQ